jgi:hypothetical protein
MSTFPSAGVALESTTEYSETTRPAWVTTGVATKTISNTAAPATFTFTSATTIQGAFMSSSSVKGGGTGVLAAASKFTSAKVMAISDSLTVSYTLTIQSV